METWKPLKNFPSYNVSSEGRIMNIKTQRILIPVEDPQGRCTVCLRKNNRQYTVKVHKVIAETFLGEYPGLDVRHKNGDQSDNRVDNLKWCTRSETISSAYSRGTKRARKYTKVRVIETDKVYDSVLECSKDICCDKSEIFKYLAGKRNNVKGYHFERL